MALALLEGLEPVMSNSLLDLLQVEVHWHASAMTYLVGGMDHLPNAFLPALRIRILFGAEIVALDYDINSVTVHYKTSMGLDTIRADFAILGLPFPALRFVDILKPFSYAELLPESRSGNRTRGATRLLYVWGGGKSLVISARCSGNS